MKAEVEAVRDILDRCELTAAWGGVEITALDQRNCLGDTPLHTICSWGEAASVKRLLAAGADVNARGDKGCTPLFNAVVGQSVAVVKELIATGADTSLRSPVFGLVADFARNARASTEVLAELSSAKPNRRH